MKSIIRTATMLAGVCLLAGCATSGLSTREQSTVSYANYILGLRTSQTSTVPAKINAPLHLAVAQAGEPAPSSDMLAKLRGNHALVASVVGLPLPAESRNPTRIASVVDVRLTTQDGAPSGNATDDFAEKVRSVCNVARAVGADYVFIYGGRLDSWHEQNGLMLLDITIIGAATIPSTKIHCESRAAGVLIQADTAEPVLFVNVESKLSGRSPSYLVEGKTDSLRIQLRDEITASLTDELLQKLAATK